MYESSLRHPVCAPEINVKACNSVQYVHIVQSQLKENICRGRLAELGCPFQIVLND